MSAKYLIVDLEDSKAWDPISFGDMFKHLLTIEGEQWDICRVACGDSLPNVDNYNSVVLTGSHYNIKDRSKLPWFDSIVKMIQCAYFTGYPNIYGGCFGCQVIGHSLGGIVDRNAFPTVNKEFILKVEEFNFNDRIRSGVIKHVEDCNIVPLNETWSGMKSSPVKVIESHGFCCSCVPRINHQDSVNFIPLASSSSTMNEVFMCGNVAITKRYNILACQGHPEFSQYLKYCIH